MDGERVRVTRASTPRSVEDSAEGQRRRSGLRTVQKDNGSRCRRVMQGTKRILMRSDLMALRGRDLNLRADGEEGRRVWTRLRAGSRQPPTPGGSSARRLQLRRGTSVARRAAVSATVWAPVTDEMGTVGNSVGLDCHRWPRPPASSQSHTAPTDPQQRLATYHAPNRTPILHYDCSSRLGNRHYDSPPHQHPPIMNVSRGRRQAQTGKRRGRGILAPAMTTSFSVGYSRLRAGEGSLWALSRQRCYCPTKGSHNGRWASHRRRREARDTRKTPSGTVGARLRGARSDHVQRELEGNFWGGVVASGYGLLS